MDFKALFRAIHIFDLLVVSAADEDELATCDVKRDHSS